MSLSNLSPARGSVKSRKVTLGRGSGSGKGRTSARGHNGAKSRSGYSRKNGFEGGQMPLYRRIPKFGFKNINRKEYQCISLKRLIELINEDNSINNFDVNFFINRGLASKGSMVKIIGNNPLPASVNVSAHKFTKSAKQLIEQSGGTATEIV